MRVKNSNNQGMGTKLETEEKHADPKCKTMNLEKQSDFLGVQAYIGIIFACIHAQGQGYAKHAPHLLALAATEWGR